MNNAAVLFISGQSNAHAHDQKMEEKDWITTPLKNVFALDRKENQSFDITDVTWSGYTSTGKNLGETQDNTYCFAYYMAKMWQRAIDAGKELPDLYIVQISIGAQGIINGMWNRDKEKILKPGVLGTVDIALFPLALHIYHLAIQNLKNSGKNPQVIGWHWIGSEQEIWYEAYKKDDFSERYDYFFDAMLDAIGMECPLYLYKIYPELNCKRYGLPVEAASYINKELQRQCSKKQNATMVKAEKSPYWNLNEEKWGIFSDYCHYIPKVQQWFAEQFFTKVVKE